MGKRGCLYLVVINGIFIIITSGCKKEYVSKAFEVNTVGISLLTPVSASCSAIITTRGSTEIIEAGVCWSKIQPSAVSDNKTSENYISDSHSFTANLAGLFSNTNYYVRAYATGKSGTVYGNELSFTTPVDHSGEKGTVSDMEGNLYQTTGIGSQIWTTENMRATKLNDGSDIIPAKCYRCWSFITSPGYCWYDNDEMNKSTYGGLYNWYTVNSMKLCPSGWHVPGDDEWTILETFLGGSNVVDALSCLPGGYRGDLATFIGFGEFSVFWTSSMASSDKADYRSLQINGIEIKRGISPVGWGASVRCVKD